MKGFFANTEKCIYDFYCWEYFIRIREADGGGKLLILNGEVFGDSQEVS